MACARRHDRVPVNDHQHEHRAGLWLGKDGWPSLVLSGLDGRSLVRFDTGDSAATSRCATRRASAVVGAVSVQAA